MTWISSRLAWGAVLIALFGLMRGLRGLVDPDDRPTALVAAGVVLVGATLLPTRFGGRTDPAPDQAGTRKAAQVFGAAGVTLLATFLGVAVVVAAVLGVVAAAAVAVLWPAPPAARAQG